MESKINNDEMMIKGIDEIPIFSWNTQTKEFYVLGHKFDGVNSIEDFINYIYNLDKENKQLKEQRQELRSWLEKKLASDNYSDGMYYGFKICLSKLNESDKVKE